MKLHSQEKTLLLGLLVCGLVMMLGTSFAYFTGGSVGISGSGSSSKLNVTPSSQKVTYDAGTSAINLVNAYPGIAPAEKDFTVKVTPGTDDKDFHYAIKLVINSNKFTKCNDVADGCHELVYTLTGSDGSVIKSGDLEGLTGEVLLATEHKLNVTADTLYNYKFKVEFKDVDYEQNHNAGKSVNALLKVEFAASGD